MVIAELERSVRLRFVNAAAMTFFDVRIPGLKMTVVAADGQDVEPVTVDEFRIAVAETLDVLVEPKDDRAYSVFAQDIDRSGYARGTLTPDPSLQAPVPTMDALPILTHMDMDMDMDMGMGHGQHGGHDMAAMEHRAHTGHDMGTMDRGQHQAMGHAGHDMSGGSPQPSKIGSGCAGYGSRRPVVHPETEYGPHVDMRTDGAQYRLDDPGVGLRDNGRRVLAYADLRNRRMTADPREPGREVQLHLTGNMSRYMWSMDGVKFADAEPVQLQFGERVRITFVNDTMMNHPIHLHGMWSELETGDADAWIGKDLHKLWLKTEGEHVDGAIEAAYGEVLYSRAISPYWDLQAGWRHDFRPQPDRDWLALGFKGLAPYWFEVDATLYAGGNGGVAGRLDAEYELLFTQRLILAPELEVSFYGQDDAPRGIGSGVSDLELGLRLRYEIRREIAPYVGINWEKKFGGTADFAREAGAGLLRTHCSQCHGSNAQGTPDWRRRGADGNFPPPPLNGTAHTWHHPLTALPRTIKQGGAAWGGTMPGFADKLDDGQVDAVWAGLKSHWHDETYAVWIERNRQAR